MCVYTHIVHSIETLVGQNEFEILGQQCVPRAKEIFVYTCHRFVSRSLKPCRQCDPEYETLVIFTDLAYIPEDLSCNQHLCECPKSRIMSLFNIMHIPYKNRIVLHLILSNCT